MDICGKCMERLGWVRFSSDASVENLNQLECCRGLGDVLLESYVYFLFFYLY